MLQNSGRERMIDLLDARLSVAESTLSNLISVGLYSNGTGAGGKQIDGLDKAVSETPTTGIYGGINRATATNAFWRNMIVSSSAVPSSSTIQGFMNDLWVQQVRGTDRPDLIMADNSVWTAYVESLQSQQRFTSPETGSLGFSSIKFMDSDVVLDGGIGGACPTGTGFFLNTDYIHYRPHAGRNMVPLSPNRRYATNQDAEVQILAWAGNLTCSGAQFQGRLDLTA